MNYVEKIRNSLNKGIRETKRVTYENGLYVGGTLAGAVLAYTGLREKSGHESILQRVRRYGQVAIGAGLTALSVYAAYAKKQGIYKSLDVGNLSFSIGDNTSQ